MWVSRKEFDKLKESHIELTNRIKHVDSRVDTLTKQIKCSCENFEVRDVSTKWMGYTIILSGYRYEKHCLDCGWTTTYDTEEEALADKQALLDKQIGALKEQKKSLKK